MIILVINHVSKLFSLCHHYIHLFYCCVSGLYLPSVIASVLFCPSNYVYRLDLFFFVLYVKGSTPVQALPFDVTLSFDTEIIQRQLVALATQMNILKVPKWPLQTLHAASPCASDIIHKPQLAVCFIPTGGSALSTLIILYAVIYKSTYRLTFTWGSFHSYTLYVFILACWGIDFFWTNSNFGDKQHLACPPRAALAGCLGPLPLRDYQTGITVILSV